MSQAGDLLENGESKGGRSSYLDDRFWNSRHENFKNFT